MESFKEMSEMLRILNEQIESLKNIIIDFRKRNEELEKLNDTLKMSRE